MSQGKDRVHGVDLVGRIGGVPRALAVVQVVDVVFAAGVFLEVGDVAIELRRTFDEGVGALAQPVGVHRELVALPGQGADAGADAQDVRAMAEDLRARAAVACRALAAFAGHDEMPALPMAIRLKIPPRVVAVLGFSKPLELRRTF